MLLRMGGPGEAGGRSLDVDLFVLFSLVYVLRKLSEMHMQLPLHPSILDLVRHY